MLVDLANGFSVGMEALGELDGSPDEVAMATDAAPSAPRRWVMRIAAGYRAAEDRNCSMTPGQRVSRVLNADELIACDECL